MNRRQEGTEEPLDVGMVWIVVQHFIDQAAKGVVVHDREDTERPVVQLVGRDEAREVRQRPVEVVGIDVDQAKVDALSRGEAPFFEPDLDDLLADGVASLQATMTEDLRIEVR